MEAWGCAVRFGGYFALVISFSHHLLPRFAMAPFVLAGMLLAGPLVAANLEVNTEYLLARRALAEGSPGVAALRAEELLQQQGHEWSTDEKTMLATLAAEGWTRDGQPDRVLRLTESEPRPYGVLFWRGQALLMQQKLEEAEEVLRGHERAGRYSEQARLCLALVFMAQGRDALARRELKELRESKDPELAQRARLMFNESELPVGRHEVVIERLLREPDKNNPEVMFLRARAALQGGQFEEASKLAKQVLKSPVGGMRLHHAAALLEAEILLGSGRVEEAQSSLVTFLDQSAEGDFQLEAFDLLTRVREVLPEEKQAELPPEVLLWTTQSAQRQRQAHALYLAADWLAIRGRTREAVGVLESLLVGHPGHRMESAAMRRAMEIQGSLGHDARVLELAEVWRKKYGGGGISVVDLITGALLFGRGEFTEAMTRFQRAADLAGTLGERRRSLFNAAIAAIRAGESALYASLIGQLQSVSTADAQGVPSSNAGSRSGETAADLELDRALSLAASGQSTAALELLRFVEAYPDHARWVEAQVVLAELALLDTPPRVKAAETALDEASRKLEQAGASAETNEMLQRVGYTRMWCKEAEADWKGVTEAGLAFLKAWPEAAISAEVRMKVADGFFRLEDYANAQTQFELVAKNDPTSEFAEAAIYSAGKAAMSLRNVDVAVGLWETLAAQDGGLSRAARLQQALAKRREGKEAEALKVVNGLLGETALDEVTRRMLLCEKAELLIQMGAVEAKHLDAAVAVLRDFLKAPEIKGSWRARGGYWLAYALHKLKQDVAALVACQNVTEQQDLAQGLDPDAAAWYYRAGFLAVELLEQKGHWEGAARMAERLAQAGGERATEAQDIATKIRLQRFLWDEKR